MDSRLSGLDDSHAVFYRDAVNYSKELNDGNPVDSVIFTHIALPEYGDAIEYSKSVEYHDLTGCFGRNPCDLASGTRALFPVIKELGVTDLVVCGHDHENAYYNEYDGVRLAYSMKSSDGDGYDNAAAIGGSVVSIGGENEDFYYSKADIGFSITDEKSFQLDALSYWRFSGAKFAFDVELPTTGSIRFSLLGTNFMRGNIAEKERCGAWNRLTSNINIDAATKTANFGALTQISGNKYRYELDLTAVDLNKNSGEVAYGDETLRLAYFSNANAEFKVSNIGYEFEKVTETNQVDLANAVITGVVDKASQKGLPVKQDVTVTLNGKTLKAVDDILVKYENNVEVGTATLTVVVNTKEIQEEQIIPLCKSYEINYLAATYNMVYEQNATTRLHLKNKAERDELTGLLNRAAFNDLVDFYKNASESLAFLIMDVDYNNSLIEQKVSEDKRDYELFKKFVLSGEDTIKSWYENNNIDLSLDRIKHIASANNWLERLQNYRIYNEQVNLLKRRYKLDICSNNTLDTLINCINNCGGLISDKLENYDGNYNNYAVLYRTNAQSQQIEQSLNYFRIPNRVIGGVKFFERREIKDIILVLPESSRHCPLVESRRKIILLSIQLKRLNWMFLSV